MTLKKSIESLGPYQSLLLLALPVATVEPLKLVAVAIAGKGHWLSGTAMIIACYATSLLLIERLFLIVKPKLLTLAWFVKLWSVFIAARNAFLGTVRSVCGGLRKKESSDLETRPRAARQYARDSDSGAPSRDPHD